MKKLSLILMIIFSSSFMLPNFANGSRTAPKPVEPLIYDGIEYTSGGFYVIASDAKTGEKLWELKVYEILYGDFERDIYDRFITSLSIKDGKLIVVNEGGGKYEVDLKTKEIKERKNAQNVVAASEIRGGLHYEIVKKEKQKKDSGIGDLQFTFVVARVVIDGEPKDKANIINCLNKIFVEIQQQDRWLHGITIFAYRTKEEAESGNSYSLAKAEWRDLQDITYDVLEDEGTSKAVTFPK